MRIVFSCLIFLFCVSCSTKKVTEFRITNENNYPINVKVSTGNVTQTFSGIKPAEQFTGIYDWTLLEKKDGEWLFSIENAQTGGAVDFHHGYYSNGELYNYVTLISKGDQLKVQVTE